MDAHRDVVEFFPNVKERLIGHSVAFFKNEIEVADRLMIMQADGKGDFVHS
jgi:hypothetical protein